MFRLCSYSTGRMKEQRAALTMPTLGTLYRAGEDLACQCHGCGHRAVLPAMELMRFYGPDATLKAIERRLRCRRCGGRETAAIAERFRP